MRCDKFSQFLLLLISTFLANQYSLFPTHYLILDRINFKVQNSNTYNFDKISIFHPPTTTMTRRQDNDVGTGRALRASCNLYIYQTVSQKFSATR